MIRALALALAMMAAGSEVTIESYNMEVYDVTPTGEVWVTDTDTTNVWREYGADPAAYQVGDEIQNLYISIPGMTDYLYTCHNGRITREDV